MLCLSRDQNIICQTGLGSYTSIRIVPNVLWLISICKFTGNTGKACIKYLSFLMLHGCVNISMLSVRLPEISVGTVSMCAGRGECPAALRMI